MGLDYKIMELVQSLSRVSEPVMNAIFCFFTFLVEDMFLVVVILCVYWAVNKKLGENLVVLLCLSSVLNGILKDLIRRPRPFLTEGYEELQYVKIDNFLVDTIGLSDSFSFPSGHSMLGATFFSFIALWYRKKKITVLCVIATLAVMLSRVYLGVHFPSDVLCGAVIGVLLAIVMYYFYVKRRNMATVILIVTLAAVITGILVSFSKDTVKGIGLLLGAFVGMLLEHKYIRFSTETTKGKKVMRVVIGAILGGALLYLLEHWFADSLLLLGFAYALLGVFATVIWPIIFTKLRL